MSNTITAVAVLPDGTEHYAEKTVGRFGNPCMDIAEEAIRAAGLTTPRATPQTVSIEVFKLTVEGGKMQRKSMGYYKVNLPLAAMTDDEYTVELNTAVSGLPPEFADWVKNKAWDDGHSGGYENVVSLAGGMADGLERAIAKYANRIVSKRSGVR